MISVLHCCPARIFAHRQTSANSSGEASLPLAAARGRQDADMSAKFLVDLPRRRAIWRMARADLAQEQELPAGRSLGRVPSRPPLSCRRIAASSQLGFLAPTKVLGDSHISKRPSMGDGQEVLQSVSEGDG
ncbi:hypothetical protein NKJ23_33715, partial [Mesorhizobium sp. M0184]|uniref:hypothetical protein n=1 Tax=Mesorhizobium sp. M0184 TaxID=2956906 RepID=UPI00333A0526